MKKYFLYIGLAAALMQSASCTKDFEEINTDPTQADESVYNPNYLLASSEYAYASKGYGYFMYTAFWSQTLASTSTLISNYLSNGDKYVATGSTPSYAATIWNNNYGSTDRFSTGAGALAYFGYKLAMKDPNQVNVAAMCRIMGALIIEQTTDVYGDAPYSQAYRGDEGIRRPKWDTQKEIYTQIFHDLDTAATMLDASKTAVTGDPMYGGDVTKWKKFAYSIMLHAAMRLTKVEPATAQEWAEKAVAGGVFTSAADEAVLVTDNNRFPNSQTGVYGTDLYETRWSKTYIDYLKNNADPRLGVITEVPDTGLAANKSTAAGSKVIANQIGLPNGYDLSAASTGIENEPNYPGATGSGPNVTPIGKYSRPVASVYTASTTPIFLLTYAETELLLAEAAVRGWNAGGTAATHYAAGTAAGLTSLAKLGSALTIDAGVATAYAAAHPLITTSTDASLKQINEQIWVATGAMFNYYESYMNWKRSGYPVLTPVVYSGNFSGGTIPRRQIYPVDEATNNPAGYASGVSTLTGGDVWTARVWWDL